MKLFIPVSAFQELMKIWSDLNKVRVVRQNELLLNVDKFKTITFSRSRHLVEFSNMLDGTVLNQVSSINVSESSWMRKLFFRACGRHGYKGLCDARIYQETFVGV
jgi:hypothetical protein